MNRRTFLSGAAGAALALSLPNTGVGSTPRRAGHKPGKRDWRAVVLDRDRWLQVHRPASKESAKVCYFRKGKGWQKREYSALCHMLRDVTYKKATRIDPKLLDLLYIIQAYLLAKKLPYVIHINSGYRTAAHNASLKGAATNSLHLQGKAADIFVPGLPVKDLAKLVKGIGVGGVGIYARKNFVHVDVGRIRTWVGELLLPRPTFELESEAELFAGEQLWLEGAV